MDDPRDSQTSHSARQATQISPPPIDDAEAMIAWYLSEEFEEHLDRCFGEAKREAIDERDRVLREHQKTMARESTP